MPLQSEERSICLGMQWGWACNGKALRTCLVHARRPQATTNTFTLPTTFARPVTLILVVQLLAG